MNTHISLCVTGAMLAAALAAPGTASASAYPAAQSRVIKRQPSVQTKTLLESAPLQLPGYSIWREESSREEEYRFRTGEGSMRRIGFLRRTEFHIEGDAEPSTAEELIGRYAGRMDDAGAEVLYRDDERATFHMITGEMESWVEVRTTDDGYIVTVIDDISSSDLRNMEWQVAPAGSLAEASALHPTLHPGSDLSIAEIEALRPPMVTYHVSADVGYGGDGSEEAPFGTIARALEHAGALEAMKVRVILHFGIYDESVTITRATDIIGQEPIPKIRGTIDGAGRNLRLENIEVREAPDYGILQAGGALEMTNCRTVGPRRSNDDPASGRGLKLSGGATATLSSCVFRSNEGQALLLTGSGTKATCSDLQASYNQVHPLAAQNTAESGEADGTACIEAVNGAKLQMEEFDLVDNEYIGVLIRDDAKAHMRNGRFEGTIALGNYGGFNLLVKSGSHIELRHIVTSNSTCGVFLIGSWMRVIDIEVIGNSFGFACHEPPEGYVLETCLYAYEENVWMDDNGINFETPGAVGVPDPVGVIEEGEEETVDLDACCPEVPWE